MPENAGNTPAIGRRGAYPKGVARRAEILNRAIEVFRERGVSGTSLRSIAEALGVSHAALLHYFDSRDHLLVAVYEHHEKLRDTGRPGAVDSMVAAATANVQVPGFVELYTALVAASLDTNNTAARDFFSARFERVRQDTAERLRRDQAAGLVRDDLDPEAVASLIIAASDGLQVQWLLDPSIALEKTLASFADLLRPRA